MDSSSVFVDLGCGRGRAVLQVAMHSTVSKAVGIELSESRLEQAEAALEVLQQQGVPLRPVELRHADLSSCSLQEGTHFYLCSTAFGAGICRCAAGWIVQAFMSMRIDPVREGAAIFGVCCDG
jgi:hypothetical protein